ncbi:MAG: phosphoribosylglycinamide formyltransferase [Cyclobacteriaceae bacterium]|nr:phosphoribosylglycinamide formyltransferase [Cyclobacteriaceae bacterium]
MKTLIAIFASGSGTNAEEIIRHFKNHEHIQVALILSNNPDAYVLTRAKNHHIPTVLFDRNSFYKETVVDEALQKNGIEFIVLAGFMWLMPGRIVRRFSDKMINIHPALLPAYGGKGMYGIHVHEAVVKNRETQSGITIHLVNEEYDKGKILFQATCPLEPTDTADDVAVKVHALEYAHYPAVIEQAILMGK